MKKEIKKLIILTIFLTIISTIVILWKGREYELSFFNVKDDNYTISIENGDGSVEILKEEIKGNELKVRIKETKAGKANVFLDQGGFTEGKNIYVHKSKIITEDNYFGNCTASEVIPISISLILIYTLYILIKRYRHNTKENLYQFRNVAYLGIIIFLSFFTLMNIISIFNYNGLSSTIDDTINSTGAFSIILFPLALITSILVTISNILLIKKEGKSWRNLLGLFLGIFICVFTLLPDFVYRILLTSHTVNIYNLNSAGPYIYNFAEALVYLTITYIECILISTIIIAIKAANRKIEHNKDYMIILGCQIKKDGTLTPLLKGRVDKAIEFRNEQLKETNKDLIFIPSGGQGSNEIISEAEAMKNYLIEQGIPKKNILIDDKSKNTYENISFSNKLINKKNAKVAFSTNKYHVFRAGLIATNQNLYLEGIGSKTKIYFWVNAFIREFIGTLYSEKKKHFIIFGLIIVVLIIMITITYFANNL